MLNIPQSIAHLSPPHTHPMKTYLAQEVLSAEGENPHFQVTPLELCGSG